MFVLLLMWKVFSSPQYLKMWHAPGIALVIPSKDVLSISFILKVPTSEKDIRVYYRVLKSKSGSLKDGGMYLRSSVLSVLPFPPGNTVWQSKTFKIATEGVDYSSGEFLIYSKRRPLCVFNFNNIIGSTKNEAGKLNDRGKN